MVRDSIYLKLDWADKRIDELHSVLRGFVERDPYGVAVEFDRKAGKIKFTASKNSEPPPQLSLLAGDILQNVRSALDYLVHELVVANGRKPSERTAFPIADSPEKYKPSFYKAKIKGVRKEAEQLIHAAKPYKGGNDTLWRLHRLNIVDKHRLLFTMGVIGSVITMPPSITPQTASPLFLISRPRTIVPIVAGREIVIEVPPETKDYDDPHCLIEVAINERGISEGWPLLRTVRGSWLEVLRLIDKFAAFR